MNKLVVSLPDSPDPGADAESRRLAPLRDKPPGSLLIHEIYRSIQGEGTRAGLPCGFIRLTACNLRCGYCDTPHAFAQGTLMTLAQVVESALALPDALIEITGGEPLLQDEVLPLMARLADHGKTVLLETSGALDIAPVDPRVHILLDLKTPGSGEIEANFWPNLELLTEKDELKFVVCDRADFDWMLGVLREHRLIGRLPILVSPAFGAVRPDDLARWILESHLPLRLQLQLHKLIWHPTRRGV
jgi:7-carboxy-7-deazaguanine synthase